MGSDWAAAAGFHTHSLFTGLAMELETSPFYTPIILPHKGPAPPQPALPAAQLLSRLPG